MDILYILTGALVLDLVLGEPPLPVHPVVWMGKVIALWEKFGLGKRPVFQFIYGVIMTLLTVGIFAAAAYFLLAYLRDWNYFVYIIVGAAVFKATFSLRELWRAALKIKRLLVAKDLDQARFNLRALVKRDSRELPESLVVSATVESVAENTCDSFTAPLFYFLIFGVPGAVAYRVINTLDAMIGMHGKYEYLGKFAARLDDVLNIIPARLTALLIVFAAWLRRRNARQSWQILLRDHARTESPNAGFPMAAAAGALNVQFTKVGHYQLGNTGQPLVPNTIDEGLRLIALTVFSWVVVCFIVEVAYIAITAWT